MGKRRQGPWERRKARERTPVVVPCNLLYFPDTDIRCDKPSTHGGLHSGQSRGMIRWFW